MLRLIAAYVQIDKHYCISGRLSTSDTILFVMSTWRTALTRLAGHVNAKTTDIYDRRNDNIRVAEVQRIWDLRCAFSRKGLTCSSNLY